MNAQTHVRPEWNFQFAGASQRFVCEMLTPWPCAFLTAADRFVEAIGAPESSAETMVLRGRLPMIAERAAGFRHDIFHRLLAVPVGRCDIEQPADVRWNDAGTSPFDAFRKWACGYDDAFEACHRWPLAIRAALLLENDPFARIDMSRMAKTLGSSRSALTHAFGQFMGQSLREYQVRVRMRRALAMLRESDISIDAVAASIGYAGTKAFHRAFRRATDLTPARVRTLSAEEVETLARTRLAVGADLRYGTADLRMAS